MWPSYVHSIDYVLASITGASLVSSSANMSANVGDGGFVSTSFSSTGDEKDAKTVVNHFSAGSSTHATQAENRSLNVGHYFGTTLRSGVRLSPFYLSKTEVLRDARPQMPKLASL